MYHSNSANFPYKCLTVVNKQMADFMQTSVDILEIH